MDQWRVETFLGRSIDRFDEDLLKSCFDSTPGDVLLNLTYLVVIWAQLKSKRNTKNTILGLEDLLQGVRTRAEEHSCLSAADHSNQRQCG